jgi:hypothetical protein
VRRLDIHPTMFVGPIMGKFLDYSHRIYRYIYLRGFGLTVLAAAGRALSSTRKFMALGGPNHYGTPE